MRRHLGQHIFKLPNLTNGSRNIPFKKGPIGKSNGKSFDTSVIQGYGMPRVAGDPTGDCS